IGNKTLDLLNKIKPEYFIPAYTVAKIARYINIVKKRPNSRKYFYGWVCRALEV
ncbi:MAG: N-acetylmuramidase, partial [Chitinophagales bacterium]|nr:N-acetylmuramidase [Chitinophagales bacterium]